MHHRWLSSGGVCPWRAAEDTGKEWLRGLHPGSEVMIRVAESFFGEVHQPRDFTRPEHAGFLARPRGVVRCWAVMRHRRPTPLGIAEALAAG